MCPDVSEGVLECIVQVEEARMSGSGTAHPASLLLVLQSTALGGMESHCVDITREFSRRGSAVTVVLPDFPRAEELRERFGEAGANRVFTVGTDARNGRLRQLVGLIRYIRILRSASPSVVHLHTGGATGGFAVVAISRALSRAATLLTEHDIPREKQHIGDRLSRRMVDRLAHGVIAVSRRNAGLREERAGAPDSFFAVYNGISLPEVTAENRAAGRTEVRERYGIAADAIVLGSVVRLAAGKGMDTLLEAYARTIRPPGTRLLVVGVGPLQSALEVQAHALGIEGEVTWAGHQSRPLPYFQAMDAFCLAVPAGSMSIALLEAMANGLPSVITFGGPDEAIISEQTGLTARPNDAEHVASQLQRLIDNEPLRMRLGTAAAAHVQEHYSAARLADDLVRVYQGHRHSLPDDLLARRPSPSLR